MAQQNSHLNNSHSTLSYDYQKCLLLQLGGFAVAYGRGQCVVGWGLEEGDMAIYLPQGPAHRRCPPGELVLKYK